MPQYPIPNDWGGTEWACIIIEWPNSVQWFGLLRGLITSPLRGRFWDASTGTITDVQNIGKVIEEKNPVTTCEDIVTSLQGIQVAVENLDVSQDLQVAIQTNIENNIALISTAIATSLASQTTDLVAVSISASNAEAAAFAWSQAIAENTQSITIINNIQNQFRPIDIVDDPPPDSSEATPTGITASLESSTPTEICKRAYWLVRALKEFIIYLDDVDDDMADTVLGLAARLSDALWAAGYRAETSAIRFLIPASVFLNGSHQLQELLSGEGTPLDELRDWIENRYQDLVCDITQGVDSELSTASLQDLVRSSLSGYGVPPALGFLPLLIMNYSSLAALYYVAPLLDPAPAIPSYEPAGICDACGG